MDAQVDQKCGEFSLGYAEMVEDLCPEAKSYVAGGMLYAMLVTFAPDVEGDENDPETYRRVFDHLDAVIVCARRRMEETVARVEARVRGGNLHS